MPPIQQLHEAFLSQLLYKEQPIDNILDTSVDKTTLTQVLSHLDAKYTSLQSELYQYVQQHLDPFSTSHQAVQDITTKSRELCASVEQRYDSISQTHSQVESTLDEYSQALYNAQLGKSKVNILEDIIQILEILESVQENTRQSQFIKAVEQLQTVKMPTNLPTSTADLIKHKVNQASNHIVNQLHETLHSIVHFEERTVKVTKGDLECVLTSFNKLGRLTEELMSIKRIVFKHIIDPYFECGCRCTVESKHTDEEAILTIKKLPYEEEEGASYRIDPVTMIDCINNMLSFFFEHLFNHKKNEMTRLFGHLFLSDLMNLMLSKSVVPAVPSSRHQLSSFDRVMESIISFEQTCQQCGFDLLENPLRTFAENIDRHYAKKRREVILKEGRKVILRKLYDAEPTQIELEDGQVQEFQITQSPQLLSVLISDTLAETLELEQQHPVSATQLTEGVQDLLDLYRAIMPSYHRPQFLSNPASALVFRNDCFWLANQLKWTARRYPAIKDTLHEALKRLEELGKAWHELCMMQCMDKIQRCLDRFDGFVGGAEDTKVQQAWDQTMSEVIQLAHSFAAAIRPVVDIRVFTDILGRVIDSLLNRLIGDIEDLTDIGAEESHVIARTLNSIAQLVGVFDHPKHGEATDSYVSQLVPNWQKFWLLKDILEMSMREIMDAFRRGQLHMFAKSELEHLLCALFADTELRRTNIEEIKSGQPPVNLSGIETIMHAEPTKAPVPTVTPSAAVSTINAPAPVQTLMNKLAYSPDDDEETTTGWDDDDDIEIPEVDNDKEGWDDDDELEIPDIDENLEKKMDEKKEKSKPIEEDIDLTLSDNEGWDDEDLFKDEK
ncbi:hypothetical protein CU097_011742 [Rhizopus azygosporus]|uniref:Uncharacterized protein n=1 Tax=Rhizopus azygosporus TaxID=86630 RepID=A0A367K731_RHIAZ|nr:hypothetical protein CU097_011742 [Rhizopus azygosporus]